MDARGGLRSWPQARPLSCPCGPSHHVRRRRPDPRPGAGARPRAPDAAEKISHGHPAFYTTKVFAYYGGSIKVDGAYQQHEHSVVVLVDPSEREALLEDARSYLPAYLAPSAGSASISRATPTGTRSASCWTPATGAPPAAAGSPPSTPGRPDPGGPLHRTALGTSPVPAEYATPCGAVRAVVRCGHDIERCARFRPPAVAAVPRRAPASQSSPRRRGSRGWAGTRSTRSIR